MSLATELYAIGVAARFGPDGKVHLLARRYSKENPRASLCGRKSFVWLATVDKTPTCDVCKAKAKLRPEG